MPPLGPGMPPLRGARHSRSTPSAASRTWPAGGACASAGTTACTARPAAPSPSAGQLSALRSTTSTARGGFGLAPARGDGRQRSKRAGAGGTPLTTALLPPRRLLGQLSPTGQHRAVLTRCPGLGHELLEVWGSTGRSCSMDLTALGKHGEVYKEGPFACLAWSHAEKQLLYVAEKSQPRPQPLFSWDAPGAAGPAEEEEEEKGEQFLYHEDWGEALSTCSMPVLCVLDIEESSITVLEGVPEDVSPGQALWSPDDSGVVFVGWWHAPFRLGLSACSNRRSGIFYLDLSNGRCELLSAEHRAACSPRLSPDGRRLLYLEGAVGGPHRQCLQLRMITWHTRLTATVLDVVREPTDAFTGIYADALPPQCWAADSRRALLSTPQRSRTDLLLVDTEVATVMNLTAGSPEGCWVLLTTQWDLLVATCSAPHQPPSLVSRAAVQHGMARPGAAWRGTAKHNGGMAQHGQGWLGMGEVWHGTPWHGMASIARHITAWLAQHGQFGTAWRGTAWPGMVRHGMAQHGMASMVRHSRAWPAQHGMAWHSMASMPQHSVAQLGEEQHSVASTAQHGTAQ
uniref:Acylamino-acid-releasing enzyme N-terminal domain-containing protein n=1 Tax=Apteryx owenii TaxID=8824 RepID=A0A8B9PII9_APTOW